MADPFIYPMQIRFSDTDAQGHVYFSNYMMFCDEAWGAYMRHIGLPYQDLLETGVDMFYVSARCDYGGSAVYEDTVLIETHITKIGTTSVTTEFNVRNDRGETLANASLVCVCIDPKTRKPVSVPDALRKAVEKFEGSRLSPAQ